MIPGRDYRIPRTQRPQWTTIGRWINQDVPPTSSLRHRYAIGKLSLWPLQKISDLQAKVTQIIISWVSNFFFLIICASCSWRHGDGSNLFPTLAALWFKSSRPPGTSAQKISAWLDLAADVIIVIVLRSDCDQLFTRVVATFALRSICWLHSWCMTQERGSGTCLTHLVRVTPGMYGPLHSFSLRFFQQCVSEFHMLNLDLVNEIERA